MSSKVLRFDTTPNPNALKCMLSEPIMGPEEAPRSYFTSEEATKAGDALGISLFAVPGVTNVLIQRGWVTVCKAPEAGWGPIKEGVRNALSHG